MLVTEGPCVLLHEVYHAESTLLNEVHRMKN